MKRYGAAVMIGALVLATGTFAGAQSPAAAPDGQAGQMAMCRQMMGGGMGGGMMGGGMMGNGMMGSGMMGGRMMGMGPMTGDPGQQAEMMAMRGEMMKAMGDIMTKYAQRMQPTK